jgi:carbonic anhydrase/acetyltransferase-like protein (isoleucine patch superfamily)
VIGNYAWVGKWTEIGVGAKVSHKTTIREGTSIGAGAWIGDGAKIGPYATICEGAKVNADTDYAASPLYIVGTRHPVCEVAPGVLAVGCEEHSIADWLAWAESIGRRNGYTPAQIAEYTAYFELAAKLQALITPALT